MYIKWIITIMAIVTGILVISSPNPIISILNLIVLYIIIAFYLIYVGITYVGLSYIVVYIGAIAILFLFIIMMIDIEVIKERSGNYLPLLLLMLGGYLWTIKKIIYNIGVMKMQSIIYKEKNEYIIKSEENLFVGYKGSEIENWTEEVINKEIESVEGKSEIWLKLNKGEIEIESENINLNWLEEGTKSEIINKEMTEGKRLIEKIYENEELISSTDLSNIWTKNNLIITPNWDNAVSRLTQISSIGDVFYTVYHVYIYILSILLLLGMVGAIILTGGKNHNIRVLQIEKNRKSNMISWIIILKSNIKRIKINKNSVYKKYKKRIKKYNKGLKEKYEKLKREIYYNKINKSIIGFYEIGEIENKSSENVIGNLNYYLISNIIVGVLLLVINTYFSISVKYLDKGGGFECGFTSFIQTRERFNVIFYRVSLLFLIFDLEIILIFPYTAMYMKNQNNAKNNVLAFLYILVIGFVYELKEGALNIVKSVHSTEINVNDLLKKEGEWKGKNKLKKTKEDSDLFLELIEFYHKQRIVSTRPYWV